MRAEILENHTFERLLNILGTWSMRQWWMLTALVPSCPKCVPWLVERTRSGFGESDLWWMGFCIGRQAAPTWLPTTAPHHSPLQGGVSLAPSPSILTGWTSYPGDRAQLFCGPCLLKEPVAAHAAEATVSAWPASGACTAGNCTHFMASVSCHTSPSSIGTGE